MNVRLGFQSCSRSWSAVFRDAVGSGSSTRKITSWT